jgi:predicted house-cleaning noncanonical NTP pyrophosphatase (MazG superfamily)
MQIFNKLVRDNMINIIESNGDSAEYEILSDEKYSYELNKKLLEEVHEYLSAEVEDHQIEELADVMEVIYAILNFKGVFREDLEMMRLNKAFHRGGFYKKIFLKSTTNKGDCNESN